MQKSIFVGVRIDPERGIRLQEVSQHRGCNQSEALRWLIDQAPALLSMQHRPEQPSAALSEVSHA